MKIILGKTGSGKSRKITELACENIKNNIKPTIFAYDIFVQDYITRINMQIGNFQSDLISIAQLKTFKIEELIQRIMEGYMRGELEVIYVDSFRVYSKREIELLKIVEKHIDIPIYVNMQENQSSSLTNKDHPVIIEDWDDIKHII